MMRQDGYTTPQGWTDALAVGDEVLVVSPVRFGWNCVVAFSATPHRVEAVTKSTATVDGRKFRRGPGRSTYSPYHDEGRGVGDGSGSLVPATECNRVAAAEQAALIEAHDRITRLRRALDRLASRVRVEGDGAAALIAKHPAAIAALESAIDLFEKGGAAT